MAGLPASGKSSVARAMKSRLNAVILDKDNVRNFLFSDYVDYARKQDDLCVNVMYEVAQYHFSRRPGCVIILDGRTYSRKYQVDAASMAADQAKVGLRIIECVCSEESARARLEADKEHHPAKDRNFELYQRSRAGQESIQLTKCVIDTDMHSESEGAALAVRYLLKTGDWQ